jgi:TrmH family RNA methyltransferase
MGSLSRVNISYCDLEKTVPLFNNSYGTYMNETSVYDIKLNKPAIVVFGNEARGISSSLEPLFKNKVSIPRYSAGIETESLNVANAAAIFLAEFRRGITEK